MTGIEELKELLGFGFKLQKAITESNEDGKITISDYHRFIGVAIAAPKAFAGIGSVPKEVKDIDEAEMQELLEFAKKEFSLADENLKELILDTLAAVLDIVQIAQRFGALRKK